ncbi:MAG: ATP synthase subunit I [Betaproteobacteria bacterium]|nr:ATP synthase subunit I [Betaproteobacteria bacterium]
MLRVVILQIGATLLTAATAGIWVGPAGALSAALGGAACFLPNLLFALRLKAVSHRMDASYPMAFLVGEAVKVVATIISLAAVALWYRDVHWLCVLAGMFVALKVNLFALLLRT